MTDDQTPLPTATGSPAATRDQRQRRAARAQLHRALCTLCRLNREELEEAVSTALQQLTQEWGVEQ
jgi:hypothetical protein